VVAAGRIGPPASTSFAMVGAALILTSRGRGGRRAAAVAGLLTIGIGTLSIVGYLFGRRHAVRVATADGDRPADLVGVAGAGDRGVVASAEDVEPVAHASRRISDGDAGATGSAVGDSSADRVGWLRLWGERAGYFDGAFGTALRTLVEVMLLTGLLYWTARVARGQERALRRSESDLRHQSGQLAAFLETAAICLHRVGPDGIVLWANDAELETLGYTREEYLGHHIAEFHADQEIITDILARLHRGERVRDREARMKCRDGTVKTVLIDSSVLWQDGRFVHTQCFTRDISGQKSAEAALRDSERRFHEMIDALPAAIYTTDAQGRLTYFNPAAVEFSGRAPELGTDRWCVTWKLFAPDGSPMALDNCPMAIALKEGRAVRGAEALAERPDGSRLWFQPYPTPVRDADGRSWRHQHAGGHYRSQTCGGKQAGDWRRSSSARMTRSLERGLTASSRRGTRGRNGYSGTTAAETVGRHSSMLLPEERRMEEDEVLGAAGAG